MRILIVDDDQAVVDALGGLIEPLGHETVGVTNGYEALARFRRDRYDFVIVDVVMPEMNGLEVMRKLRAIDRTARIVALTGSDLDLASVLGEIDIRLVRKPVGTTEAVVDLITTR